MSGGQRDLRAAIATTLHALPDWYVSHPRISPRARRRARVLRVD
jgi:hypothetical protein